MSLARSIQYLSEADIIGTLPIPLQNKLKRAVLKYDLKGTQDFYDNKIDETTGTITLRATFPNPKDQLIQGDFGRTIIYSKSKDNVPAVPQVATLENQEGRYVYVLDEKNLPRIAYIKTNGQTEDGKWVVTEGVKEGDKIITSGLQKVVPGRPVRIIDENDNQQVKNEKTSFVDKIKSLFNKIGV